jgi:hypothetical protein
VEIFVSAWAGMISVRLTWGIVIAFISLWTIRDDLSPFLMVEDFERPLGLKGKF